MYGAGGCGTGRKNAKQSEKHRMQVVKRTASAEYMKQNSHPGRSLNFEMHKVYTDLGFIVIHSCHYLTVRWVVDPRLV